MTKKVKLLKPAYYNCNYPSGSVIEVDDNWAAYALGMGDVVEAKGDEKVTDPIPYVMKPRVSDSEQALSVIANALAQAVVKVPPSSEKIGGKA